mmetsp:Transcript_5218/g.14058  ORF Transcript_5218/g.14058 Transcript_5218/m.14058 type:complete len:274 (+) Transcript_5218:331-1152(+)
MRLSAELIGSSEQRTNPLGERELVLRGLAIPSIEHLAVTQDAFDAIDFTDNRLQRLDNFPRLQRLASLNCMGNSITSIDADNIRKNVANLTYINLCNNNISALHEVVNLGQACEKLQVLSLHGNPVTRRQHYRLYTINQIPSLKTLDYIKISKSERQRAERLAKSAAGAALESDVQGEAREAAKNGVKTFVPGEGGSAEESFVTNFTQEQKDQIRQMVANADSATQIEEIEQSVKRGVFPESFLNLIPEEESKKRSSEDDGGSKKKKKKKSKH